MPGLAAVSNAPCTAGADGKVIPVDVAAAKAVAIAKPVRETERLPLIEAVGRVLGRDVVAGLDLPPFDNSAMDGYAVRLSDLPGSGPWTLPLGGRVTAGGGEPLSGMAGECIRILTGAPVPQSFDAVVMQEYCGRVGDCVLFRKRPRDGENIRRAGEDVRAGVTVCDAGRALAPHRLAILAGQGLEAVEVLRKVRIGLVSTGSELCDPGAPLGYGQIYNSNRIMIRAMLSACLWADIVDYGIVPDRQGALAETFGEATRQCDVLVTTGGVSAGEEDHVVSAFGQHGGRLDVLKVAMRPGKPVKIGMIGPMLFAGLPGNPNAALVTFRQIALPAIRTIAGLREVGPQWSLAVAGAAYEKRLGRTEFVPAMVSGYDELGRAVLEIIGRSSSASLMAMAQADGIAMLPPDLDMVPKGKPLHFEPFV